jgi:hypothetical protein
MESSLNRGMRKKANEASNSCVRVIFTPDNAIGKRDKSNHRVQGTSIADHNRIDQTLYVATRLLLTLKDALPVLGVVAIASVLWQLD